MKLGKKMLCSVLAALTLFSTAAISASAYTDGDRQVKYYNFDLTIGAEDDARIQPMQRLYNRNWVISINSVSYTNYPICYGLIQSETYYAVANDVFHRGTGNTGASYYNTGSIGTYLWLNAYLDSRDSLSNKHSSGQWSTDAAN